MYSTIAGQDCCRLSHLIYKLHTCLDYKNKLLLSSKLFNFKHELSDAEELPKRALTAVDPEFIYLLLRSSTIFKLIGLELTNLLLSNKENATHFRKVIVYVTNILKENWPRKEFKYDESTKIISEKIGDPEIVWIRLMYQCLECLDRLSDYLGQNYIFKYKTYVTELNEPLEFLVHDMFDVALTDPGDRDKTYTVNARAVGFEQDECELCGKLNNKEFKEEASLLQELYKDLDSLSKAHLDELEMEDLESGSPGGGDSSEESIPLPEILKQLANSFLEELRDGKEEASLNLFCIELLIKLLPHSTKVEFVDKCLKSNNFDILRVLMGTIQSFNTSSKLRSRLEVSQLEEINWMMFKYCVGLMESNLTRENMALVLNYMNKAVESLCVGDISYADLLKVAKRCEIEIHVGLDEVFRAEKTLFSPHAFETMEKVMTIVSEAEEPFETMDEFFAIFHRSIQLLFDYFDNLYEESRTTKNKAAEKYKESCLKLLSCWMTLEPMYYQNQVCFFMDKLEKILSLLNEFDLVWLLPTFNFVELSDMDSVNRFLELLYKLIAAITNMESMGDTGERAMKMSCNLVTRLHMDQMIDYEKMLMTLDAKNFDMKKALGSEVTTEKNTNVREGDCPSYPIEFRTPICIHLGLKSLASYELLSSVSIGLLIKMIRSTKVEFVRSRLEVGYDFKAFDKYLTSEVDLDKIENLCYATEAAASTCLSRVYEGSSAKHLDNQIMVIIMELVVHFFIHTAPRTRSEYLDDVHRISHYFTLCKICILLMQNYSTFLTLFNYSVKKVSVRSVTNP
ncbi:conserved hypothetical protein [Theileria orientalis strain Shintoku]|uniref:Uncharacterized protein n=1 Tax=Theileria orientalis strain Shintoku TaxID=869250 RepID=J4C7P4_THEOR|nr:conserved hypothetical protein [Theileria orientalis strain Shintoku]BAM39393.1 conserved hypothetical protein [Theileria orientalis strain Shintoku]|eukprot:XP_009689694.1 conserved hypothetical protein [Theileria orientalis strain Shintoku]